MTDASGFRGLYTEENIAGRPILELGARVWEPERYQAFRACYETMRMVDDLVDGERASCRLLSEARKGQIIDLVGRWTPGEVAGSPPPMRALHDAVAKFHIPVWPWKRWERAMRYDLDHNGFGSFHAFLRYSEGAAVAPGAIFIHLCGCGTEGGYAPPAFCIRRAARPLAIFSYLVHIVRDFRKDQAQGLNYFADDLLAGCRLDRDRLRRCAGEEELGGDVRDLLGMYASLAFRYRDLARRSLDEVGSCLERRYRLSVEIVFSLYAQILERVDVRNGRFTEGELKPRPEEIKQRLDHTILGLNLPVGV